MSPVAIEVALIAMAISLGSAIVNKKVVDQKRNKEIQKQVSDFQKRFNEAKKKGDKELIEKLEKEQKEVMQLSMELMKNGFKPMLYTFIPIIVIFFFLNTTYAGTGNVIDVPIIGMLSWFWWYFLVAMVTGLGFEVLYKIATREKK